MLLWDFYNNMEKKMNYEKKYIKLIYAISDTQNGLCDIHDIHELFKELEDLANDGCLPAILCMALHNIKSNKLSKTMDLLENALVILDNTAENYDYDKDEDEDYTVYYKDIRRKLDLKGLSFKTEGDKLIKMDSLANGMGIQIGMDLVSMANKEYLPAIIYIAWIKLLSESEPEPETYLSYVNYIKRGVDILDEIIKKDLIEN